MMECTAARTYAYSADGVAGRGEGPAGGVQRAWRRPRWARAAGAVAKCWWVMVVPSVVVVDAAAGLGLGLGLVVVGAGSAALMVMVGVVPEAVLGGLAGVAGAEEEEEEEEVVVVMDGRQCHARIHLYSLTPCCAMLCHVNSTAV